MTGMLGLTVYGCEPDEADLFHELCPRFGVVPTITSDAVSEASVISVRGNRCISVGHKSEISASMLRALQDTGVEHVSTRSIGVNHIDLHAAAHLGITVENAAYAPDGVADYTVMLILMAIRNAKETLSSANSGDFRLRSVRGQGTARPDGRRRRCREHRQSGDQAPARIRMPGAGIQQPLPGVGGGASSPSTNCCSRAMSSRSICR